MPPTGLNQPELVLPSQPRRVETVNFHPTADCVLASTSLDTLVIWDLIQAKELVSSQCGNYRNLLSHFSAKISWNQYIVEKSSKTRLLFLHSVKKWNIFSHRKKNRQINYLVTSLVKTQNVTFTIFLPKMRECIVEIPNAGIIITIKLT